MAAGKRISFATLKKWNWVAIGTIAVAIMTLALACATFYLATEARKDTRETELQRRNMTRPELIDVPYDLFGPDKGRKESVVFGRSYEFAVKEEVPPARPWVGQLDGDRWGCTFVLRNSGAGSARIISSSLEVRGTGSPVTVEGRSESRFVPRGEQVRFIFDAETPSHNVVAAAENESATFTATVTYEDFERVDTWETRYDFFLGQRGPDRVDVSITRVS